MNTHITRMVVAMLALTGTCVIACGPDFPTAFLSGADKEVGCSRLESELIILGTHFRPGLEKMKFPRKSPKVAVADLAEFTTFLDTVKPILPDARKEVIINDYRLYAVACRKGEPAKFMHNLAGAEEFILYLEGVRKFHLANVFGGGMHRIPDQWQAILDLPKEKRGHRTTWVLYMAGNMTDDPHVANDHYVALRKAVAEGFKDSLALAHASFRAAAMCDNSLWKLKNVFEGYCYYRQTNDKRNAEFCLGWVRTLLSNCAFDKDRAKLWAEDEICRELMTMFVTSSCGWTNYPVYMGPYSGYDRNNVVPFDLLNTLKGKTVKSAGHAAWFFYEQGRWEKSKKFADMAAEDDLLALWINGRLARRQGDGKVAAKFYARWLAVYEVKAKEKSEEASPRRIGFGYSYSYRDIHSQVRGELGLVNFQEEDFVEALHCFMLAGLWTDAAAIADRIIDTAKLMEYVDGHEKAKSNVTKEKQVWIKLRSLLARRLFRAGKFKTAMTYYAKEVLPHAKQFVAQMAEAKNSTTADDKALALYNAAKILRWKGMELAGTELGPDYTIFSGRYEYGGQRANWIDHYADTSVPKRFYASAVNPDKRFHYRYRAAGMMWDAAKHAKNKELKALALYVGGRFIELRDPKAADRFYKGLVNTNAFPLSQKADALRWFPKTYSEALNAEFTSTKPTTMKTVKSLIATMQILYAIDYTGGTIRGFVFTNDSKRIVALSNNGDVMLIDPYTGKTVKTIVVPMRCRDCLSASPKTAVAAVGGKAGSVQLVDLEKGVATKVIPISKNAITSLAWSPNGDLLAVATADGVIDLRNTGDWALRGRLKAAGGPHTLTFSPDGKTLACATDGNSIELWDVAGKILLHTLKGHRSSVRTLAFTTDGSKLYSGSDDHSARIWDATSGRDIQQLFGHNGAIAAVLPDAKGQRMMTMSMDGHFRRWDVTTGKTTSKNAVSETGIVFGAVSPDHKWAATADKGGTIRIICNPFME